MCSLANSEDHGEMPLKGSTLFAKTKKFINEPVHEISNNVACATSKASD